MSCPISITRSPCKAIEEDGVGKSVVIKRIFTITCQPTLILAQVHLAHHTAPPASPAIAAVAALIINSRREFACSLFFIGLGF
jgi:hypothetical protein